MQFLCQCKWDRALAVPSLQASMSKWILERPEEAAAPLSSPSAPPTSPMSGVHGFSAGIAGGKVPPETAKLLQSEVEALGAVDVNDKCLGRVMGEWLLKLREAHTRKHHTSIPVTHFHPTGPTRTQLSIGHWNLWT